MFIERDIRKNKKERGKLQAVPACNKGIKKRH